MKKLICFFLIFAFLIPASEAAIVVNSTAAKATLKPNFEQQTLRKRKGYHKKRGFMWGLFKKRNSCDCPKH